jgi:hypothetical protein
MGSPINYAAPSNPAPKLAPTVGKGNPYLTSSPYENMQLHTPSGMYYNNGKVYESYTPEPINRVTQALNQMTGGLMYANQPNQTTTTGGPVEGSIQSGDQWFKPYTGNAAGIINGDLSMVGMLGSQPTYQPQPMADLFPSLNASLLQSQPASSMQGAGRFLGSNLLGLPITTNTQGK